MAKTLEEQLAEQRLAGAGGVASGGVGRPVTDGGASGANFTGDQVKDGRLTPEYQEALSSRFEQLGHGNPFSGASTGAAASPLEQQIAKMRGVGMSFSFTPPSGFGA